ncbi:MAG: hypothetical protein K0S32_2095 [Bacteroidetes bacterium]|jgi:hypothetical protein|nr:hypothetical protein [Bacteroidota bacterium]
MKQENIISHGAYLKELTSIFASNTREKAHELSESVLKEMTSDRAFFEAVIRYNLSDPDFMNSMRNYERLLRFKVIKTADFNLVLNVLPPSRNHERISVKGICHHRDRILTTINAFGPGYESVLFKKDFHVSRINLRATMEIDRIISPEKEQMNRIDSYTPYAVFFPDSVTATYTLNSTNKKNKMILKDIPGNFEFLANMFGVTDVPEVCFYAKDHHIFLLKHKLKYPIGPNSTFLSNICCFLKDVNFEDRDFLKKIKEDPRILPNAKLWIGKLIKNEYDEFSYEDAHVMIAEENMKKSEILSAINSNYWRFASESGMPIVNKFEAGF